MLAPLRRPAPAVVLGALLAITAVTAAATGADAAVEGREVLAVEGGGGDQTGGGGQTGGGDQTGGGGQTGEGAGGGETTGGETTEGGGATTEEGELPGPDPDPDNTFAPTEFTPSWTWWLGVILTVVTVLMLVAFGFIYATMVRNRQPEGR
ncbi:MAG: hypothetical protein KY462_08300 [Actinobacteria bacterium]|nr:hypothetical protein [Actinomycetota bacterium]